MKIAVFAVGRLKAGPEQQLAHRYLERLSKVGPAVGLEFAGVTEFPESRAGSASERRREEAGLVHGQATAGTAMLLLDERGRDLSSAEMAARIGTFRDAGRRGLVFAIGGPDGHAEILREKAELSLAFGSQTWPHQLVRIMLAEQLYRAVTILAGHPYHRA